MNTRFKRIRKSKNMSQKEVADLLGVSDVSISKIESGQNNPSNQTVKMFCDHFGIREEWLRYGIEPIEAPKPADAVDQLARQYNLGPGATALLRATAQAYAELDEKTCAIVINKMFASLQEYIQQNQADLQMRSQVVEESPESDAASQ